MSILELTDSLVYRVAEVYPEPWKEEPWNEFFTIQEAEEIIREAFDKKGFLGFITQSDDGRIVGFTWGYLMSSSEIKKHAGWSDNLVSETVFYLAELGVLKQFQGKGFGLTLSKKIIDEVKCPVILRTDSIANVAIELYKNLGFTPLLDLSGKQSKDSNHQSRLYWQLR